MPPALTYVYCSEDDVQSLLSAEGELSRLDDTLSGSVSVTEQGWLAKAISWATSRVNFYLAARYATADLAQSWLVNEWCVVLACHWLSSRRGNPVAGSLGDLYKQALEDLKLVKTGEYQLPEIGLRTSAWPAWSNLSTSPLWALRKVRVERPISEGTPQTAPFKQNRDIAADYIVEPN